MTSGNWTNSDGLPLQFGTAKAAPDSGGGFKYLGETRMYEQYIPLVAYGFTSGTSNNPMTIPTAPTSFVGTTTFAAAGITSPTSLFPMQTTAVATTSGSQIIISSPQVFIEEVSVETIVGAAGGTSISVGFATINPATGAFVQVTPNAGVQLVNALLTANMATAGMRSTFYQPGTTTFSVPASIAGGGTWIGQMPLITNAITPLPQGAFISAISTGTFTAGLLKLRVKYNIIGGTNQ